MNKLEELKAAYEAATPGEWEVDSGTHVAAWKYGKDTFGCRSIAKCGHGLGSTVVQGESNVINATFIALAHNNMAALLEAVEILEDAYADNPGWMGRIERLLKELNGGQQS